MPVNAVHSQTFMSLYIDTDVYFTCQMKTCTVDETGSDTRSQLLEELKNKVSDALELVLIHSVAIATQLMYCID